MARLQKVFISHSHADQALAAAFKEALTDIFSKVNVAYSSDKEAGAGPQGGRNWLDWIHEQMVECQEALLLLTPYSIQKPWPMWEAGAVAGTALVPSKESGAGRAVTPLRFKLPADSLPGPFVVTQAYDGMDRAALSKMLGDLMKRYDFEELPQVIDPMLKQGVDKLLEKIRVWSETAAAPVTEGVVVEWCGRLDRLREAKRSADVAHLHRWLRLLYDGPRKEAPDAQRWGGEKAEMPWDIRLHLRLGENYALAGQAKRAIEQYGLASELAPLDVFVLHKLAKAQLDAGDPESARKTIDRILQLDPDALKWNAEVAGLEGRYWKDQALQHERRNQRESAKEAYEKARQAYNAPLEAGTERNHYLADNVGQICLKLGDRAGAEKAYERARAALEDVTESNESVWTLATRATAALVLGEEDKALAYLAKVAAFTPKPSADELGSIRRGLEMLRDGLGKTEADYQRWLGALGG